ncbi:MAG: hypothetical protein V1732_02885, partial [Patescibacteria group bacterium]
MRVSKARFFLPLDIGDKMDKIIIMTKIKPLHNNVLIEPFFEEERGIKTKAGIIIPDTIDKSRQGGTDQGKVVEVGPGKRDDSG